MKLFFALLFILLLQFPSFAQNVFTRDISSCEFKSVTFSQVIQALQRKSQDVDNTKQGFNYVFTGQAQKLMNNKVTVSLTELSLFEALKYTSMLAKVKLKYDGNTVICMAPKEKFKEPVIRESYVRRTPKFLASIKLPLKELKEEELTINELVKIIKNKSKEADSAGKGVNILSLAGSSQLKQSISLKNVSVYAALRYAAIAAGVTMKIDRAAIVLGSK